MTADRTRRTFLTDLGRTTAGLVVVGLAGCTTTGDPVVEGAPSTSPGGQAAAGDAVGLVDLGFVAAYVVQRDGRAVVVDTGVEGSEDAIDAVLQGLGLRWSAVADVVLTHSHGDHAGSLEAVAQAAPDAALWAGAADIPSMSAPREIAAVADGDLVGDLRVVATPGHTPGHISLFHPGLEALFAGDALTGADGAVAGPNREFTPDMTTAVSSVQRLADLQPRQILVGHGFPVTSGAADLTALAERLAG